VENLQKLKKYPAHFMPINVNNDSMGKPTAFGLAYASELPLASRTSSHGAPV
jgi:hypothetical protein